MLMLIVIVVLVCMFAGSVPAWPHSKEWGWGPGGGLGLIVVVLLVFYLLGHRF